MKIYTRTGDKGQTAVIGGRVDKDHIRVEAYGTTDELNAFVGYALCLAKEQQFDDLAAMLTQIQHEIFDCGSDLAIMKRDLREYKVNAEMVSRLEQWIDQLDEETEDIERFILPGGTGLASQLHVCRTVCRRAERRIVSLAKSDAVNEHVLRYINRLSDFFFTAARAANARAGVPDVQYIRSAKVFRRKQ